MKHVNAYFYTLTIKKKYASAIFGDMDYDVYAMRIAIFVRNSIVV